MADKNADDDRVDRKGLATDEKSALNDLLSAQQLEKLRKQYSPLKTADLLEHEVPKKYPRAGKYFSAVVDTYFEDLAVVNTKRDRIALEPKDRQRCIIALQAATGQESPLAIHIYIGLAVGLTIDEIANILLLAGVYTGVPNFFTGMGTLATTLQVLNSAKECTPKEITDLIQATWRVQPQPPVAPSKPSAKNGDRPARPIGRFV